MIRKATPQRARRLHRILLISGLAETAFYAAATWAFSDTPLLYHWMYDAACLTAISLTFMASFYWMGRFEEASVR